MFNGTKLTIVLMWIKANLFAYQRNSTTLAIYDSKQYVIHLIRPLFKTTCTMGCRSKRHHSVRYQCTYAWSGTYVLGTRMFLPLVCGGSVFGPCFVLHYLVSFLILQSFGWGRESWPLYFSCLTVILWLLVLCYISWSYSPFYGPNKDACDVSAALRVMPE